LYYSITESVGENVISSKISGTTNIDLPCHIWYQNLDCQDGSFIVRYKIFNSCFNLKIVIRIKNKLLSLKQSTFEGTN
jgi:hypothetical protein